MSFSQTQSSSTTYSTQASDLIGWGASVTPAEPETEKQDLAAKNSSLLREYLQALQTYVSAGVDPEFCAIAKAKSRLACRLAGGLGGCTDGAEVLAEMYLAWVAPDGAHDEEKGDLAGWTVGTLFNRMRRQKSNLCIAGRGTLEIDKPLADGQASLHETLKDSRTELADNKIKDAPALGLGGLSDLILNQAMSLPEAAAAMGKRLRTVQRLAKKHREQITEFRGHQPDMFGLGDAE